jgi:hypothetical protein
MNLKIKNKNMKVQKIIAGVGAIALAFSMTSVVFAADAGPEVIDFTVEVQDTMSMTCHETGQIDTDKSINFGIVTAGTPVFGSSDCDVVTNDENGYYLKMVNDNAAGETMTDPNGMTSDITDTLAPFDWAQGDGNVDTLVAWGANTGLGFTVTAAPTRESQYGTSTTCVDIANHSFGGAPEAEEPIMRHLDYSAVETTTTTCYILDVTAAQESGVYTGSVTYTVTSDASNLEAIDHAGM